MADGDFSPGVSAGWRISEEPFVKELVPFLTNLKLRGSWGKMGDDGAAGLILKQRWLIILIKTGSLGFITAF